MLKFIHQVISLLCLRYVLIFKVQLSMLILAVVVQIIQPFLLLEFVQGFVRYNRCRSPGGNGGKDNVGD